MAHKAPITNPRPKTPLKLSQQAPPILEAPQKALPQAKAKNLKLVPKLRIDPLLTAHPRHLNPGADWPWDFWTGL